MTRFDLERSDMVSAMVELITNEFFGASDPAFALNIRSGRITIQEHKAIYAILDKVSDSMQNLRSSLADSPYETVDFSLLKVFDVVKSVNNISDSLSNRLKKVQVLSSCVQVFNSSQKIESQFTTKYVSLFCLEEDLASLKHRVQAAYAPLYDDTYSFLVSFKTEPVLF